MRARARLVVERDRAGRNVVRELRSVSPLTLVPSPCGPHDDDRGTALVHLVGSAAAPLGGDELELEVHVGPGAGLRLQNVGATLALPGQHPGPSRTTTRFHVAEAGTLDHRTEPTIVAAHADHHAELHADLATGARLRCREVVVLGRTGERSGRFTGLTRVRRTGTTLLHQRSDLGDPGLDHTPAHLAGHSVVAAELLVWGEDPPEPVSGDWWSLVPLGRGGALATALAHDALTAERLLATALAAHPGLARTGSAPVPSAIAGTPPERFATVVGRGSPRSSRRGADGGVRDRQPS